MSIEQEVFKRRRLKKGKPEEYGFVRDGVGCFYSEVFMEGSFRAEVRIEGDGRVTGRVIDVEADGEYLPVRVETHAGAFVGAVREGYRAVLERIADACFEMVPFIYPQTNRIAALIESRYGEKPDYPFSTAPSYGVFRYPANRKWYGLVMDIRRHLLTGGDPEESPVIEVINLKAGAERMTELLAVPGIYPSYHMHRASWVSVLLDGTLPDEQVMELVGVSRDFAVNAGKSRKS